jgi:lysozyme family protein
MIELEGAVSSITRSQFIDRLEGRPLRLDALKADQRFNGLDLDAVDRNGNGRIEGRNELKELFLAIDTFDRDGSYHSMSLEDRLGQPTKAAELVEAADALAPARSARPTSRLGRAYQDYQTLIDEGISLRPQRQGLLSRVSDRAKRRWSSIDAVARRADLPPQLVAAIWYREDDQMRSSRYLHNGQRLGRTTTIVPKGIFFKRDQFVEAAVHALGQKRHLKNALGLSYESKDLAAMAAYTEAYNGFGYRMGGRPSPYVTASTDGYRSGMYVRDSVFDANAEDRRLGTLPLMRALLEP